MVASLNGTVEAVSLPADYLELTRLSDGIFLVGLLDVGVTIYNQQIRALNLVWALDRAGLLRNPTNCDRGRRDRWADCRNGTQEDL